ncbi:MAG: type IV pilus modification protein PilV [Gallionella sp.]|nr:type IV pilus modification protein PilV [Gallionella sp.]
MMAHQKNTGSSMIEILVTIMILMIGLLGLAGLQGRAMTSQMEAYQRSQALILVKDMADRINANRVNAASYVAAVGTGAVEPASAPTAADLDKYEWHNALLGAAETNTGGARVGAMIGARGCVTVDVAPANGIPARYLVAVAWQGLNNTATPAITCGQDQYGDEAKRRVVALPVNIADLVD